MTHIVCRCCLRCCCCCCWLLPNAATLVWDVREFLLISLNQKPFHFIERWYWWDVCIIWCSLAMLCMILVAFHRTKSHDKRGSASARTWTQTNKPSIAHLSICVSKKNEREWVNVWWEPRLTKKWVLHRKMQMCHFRARISASFFFSFFISATLKINYDL